MRRKRLQIRLYRIMTRTDLKSWIATLLPKENTRGMCGYERECQDYLLGGEAMSGALEDIESQLTRAYKYGYLPA